MNNTKHLSEKFLIASFYIAGYFAAISTFRNDSIIAALTPDPLAFAFSILKISLAPFFLYVLLAPFYLIKDRNAYLLGKIRLERVDELFTIGTKLIPLSAFGLIGAFASHSFYKDYYLANGKFPEDILIYLQQRPFDLIIGLGLTFLLTIIFFDPFKSKNR